MHSEPRRLALVGNYPPRRCGIATFTHDLFRAFAARGDVDCSVTAINDVPGGYDYPDEVSFELREQELGAYARAADYLNFQRTDVVALQHEFGIYGGPAGSHLLTLLQGLHMPAVVTLHTVLQEPDAAQRHAMLGLRQHCARFIVMSEQGRSILQDTYEVPADRIDVIPHGIADLPFVDPNYHKDELGLAGRYVALTFGLLSPGKGIESALRALPRIVAAVPNFVYVVLGATHPTLLRQQGEQYREQLEALCRELGITEHVIFHNRFVDDEELQRFLDATDLYITPYLNPAQITSGALSYAFGSGKPVISTPYRHALELLADDRGVLVPFGDADALAEQTIDLLRNETRRHAMRKRAYLHGRSMVWSRVADMALQSYARAIAPKVQRASVPPPGSAGNASTLTTLPTDLPPFRLDHVQRLTDATGMFQHAHFSFLKLAEGYCTDDNARALLFCVMAQEAVGDAPGLLDLLRSYAGFLDHALTHAPQSWHNFMHLDRRWLDECGSDDALGRCLQALGACVGRARQRDFILWAQQLFVRCLPALENTTSPRAWATGIIGIREYLRRPLDTGAATEMQHLLTERLLALYRGAATPEWPWPEESLSYDNPRLPHAMLVIGADLQHAEALQLGLQSLRWLMTSQTSAQGNFRPIGCHGYQTRGNAPAAFDQLPIEACAAISACLEAHRLSGDASFLQHAKQAFRWFLGRNDLSLPLYDAASGGCRDGLHADRRNRNQGAESTLAFWQSWVELRCYAMAHA